MPLPEAVARCHCLMPLSEAIAIGIYTHPCSSSASVNECHCLEPLGRSEVMRALFNYALLYFLYVVTN